MSRYIREEMIQKPADFVDFIMSDFLQKHGFVLVNINGETVYQHGKGMLTAPKYFSYRYANGVIHIEAWIKFAWLPGVYGKESDLSGFTGSMLKAVYKKDIEELISVLCQPLPGEYQNTYGQQAQGGYPNAYGQQAQGAYPNAYNQQPQGGYPNAYGQQPQSGYPNAYGQQAQGGPITVKGVDTANYAKSGLVFVLVGIPILIFNAWLGLLFAGIGIGFCYRGMGSSKNGMATVGFVLGIIEAIFAVVCGVIYIMQIVQ